MAMDRENVLKPITALRVLLADDNARVRQNIKDLLEMEGFKVVVEAADGEQAVALAHKHNPDVILLDLSMPHVNGIEATRRIQKVIPGARTIILTVHRDYHYLVQALEAGVSGYIIKAHATRDLAKGVLQVAEGKHFFSQGLPQELVHNA